MLFIACYYDCEQTNKQVNRQTDVDRDRHRQTSINSGQTNKQTN